jgi:hypothetical protein
MTDARGPLERSGVHFLLSSARCCVVLPRPEFRGLTGSEKGVYDKDTYYHHLIPYEIFTYIPTIVVVLFVFVDTRNLLSPCGDRRLLNMHALAFRAACY